MYWLTSSPVEYIFKVVLLDLASLFAAVESNSLEKKELILMFTELLGLVFYAVLWFLLGLSTFLSTCFFALSALWSYTFCPMLRDFVAFTYELCVQTDSIEKKVYKMNMCHYCK